MFRVRDLTCEECVLHYVWLSAIIILVGPSACVQQNLHHEYTIFGTFFLLPIKHGKVGGKFRLLWSFWGNVAKLGEDKLYETEHFYSRWNCRKHCPLRSALNLRKYMKLTMWHHFFVCVIVCDWFVNRLHPTTGQYWQSDDIDPSYHSWGLPGCYETWKYHIWDVLLEPACILFVFFC